jgi:hypothetical protein
LRLPAFFMQPYERVERMRSGRTQAWLYPAGMPVWRARFAPVLIGPYSARVECSDANGTRRSPPVAFQCTPSANRGFVRVSRSDSRYFEFSEGQPFFPIGQNLAFIGESQFVTPPRVPEIFQRLSTQRRQLPAHLDRLPRLGDGDRGAQERVGTLVELEPALRPDAWRRRPRRLGADVRAARSRPARPAGGRSVTQRGIAPRDTVRADEAALDWIRRRSCRLPSGRTN